MSSESKWKRTISSTPPTSKTKISGLSPSDPNSITRTNIIPASSLSLKSVWLYDWWLVKAEGSGLAVAGSASRDGLGERSFLSAAIVKRHSTNILEAKDGITVTLSGFINRERTCENGFSFQICERFHLGFPYCWEEFATPCCGEESANRRGPDGFVEPNGSFGINTNTSSVSFDDLPVTRMRDLLMHTLGDSEDCALAHILEHFCANADKQSPMSTNPNSKTKKSPVAAANHMPDKTPKGNKSAKADKKHKDADKIPHATDTVIGECISPTRRVMTRSMSRVNVGKMQEDISLVIGCKRSRNYPEPVSMNTPLKIKNSASFSTSEGAKNLSGLRTPSSVLKGSPAIRSSEGVIKASDVFVGRRSSSRLKIRKDYSNMEI